VSIIRSIQFLNVVGVAIVAAATLSACGSDGPDADTASDTTESVSDATGAVAAPTDEATEPAAPGETVEVKALDNTFVEDSVEVAAGTEVVWRNGGRNDHDIVPVADDESWGVGIEAFHPGDEYSYTFTEPGEYAYFCTIHGTTDVGMTGTIVVK
jgi:plastocyanin